MSFARTEKFRVVDLLMSTASAGVIAKISMSSFSIVYSPGVVLKLPSGFEALKKYVQSSMSEPL